MAEIKLKPCPFCKLELDDEGNYQHPENDCFLAHADAEFGAIYVTDYEIEAWNRRAE